MILHIIVVVALEAARLALDLLAVVSSCTIKVLALIISEALLILPFGDQLFF